jgi:hypothetical protein
VAIALTVFQGRERITSGQHSDRFGNEKNSMPQCAFKISMFNVSAIHINSRSLLRFSSIHEPSDPPLRIVCFRAAQAAFLRASLKIVTGDPISGCSLSLSLAHWREQGCLPLGATQQLGILPMAK